MYRFLLVAKKHASQRTMADKSIETGKTNKAQNTRDSLYKFSRLTQREHRMGGGCLTIVTATMLHSVPQRKNTMCQRQKLSNLKDTILILRNLSNFGLPASPALYSLSRWGTQPESLHDLVKVDLINEHRPFVITMGLNSTSQALLEEVMPLRVVG